VSTSAAATAALVIATCKATRYSGDATDDGQEIRFEAFVKQAFGVKVK
jgi:hypothetical protein